MATELSAYAPFDAGSGANVLESTWRDFMRHVLADGVILTEGNLFAVFADSTGMQVKVKSGACWIRGHWGRLDAQTTLPLTAAHATLSRIDSVVLRADFVDNVIELDVKPGTPAGSPSPPSLTQTTAVWEIRLANVTVGAAVSTITAANVDKSVTPYTGGTEANGTFTLESNLGERPADRPLTWRRTPSGWVSLSGWARRSAGGNITYNANTQYAISTTPVDDAIRPPGNAVKDFCVMTSQGAAHIALRGSDGLFYIRYLSNTFIEQGQFWVSFDGAGYRLIGIYPS